MSVLVWSHFLAVCLELEFVLVIVMTVTSSSATSSTLEFRDSKQGEFARSLSSYHVTIPTRVDERGDHVTHSLRHLHSTPPAAADRRRKRRDATSGPGVDSVHYKVNVEGHDRYLTLTPNYDLFAPGLVVEHRGGSGHKSLSGVKVRRLSGSGCHFVGKVVGHAQSVVAIATCDGLHGFIRIGKEEYFIEPVKGHNESEVKGHPHLVYRRSALPPESHIGHDGTGSGHRQESRREEGTCGVTDDHRKDHEHAQRSRSGSGKDEAGGRGRRRKRSVSVERHVETLVVVDSEMSEYYKHDNIENYVLTIMNIVSTMFHESSIGNAINIALVRIIYVQKDEKNLTILHHAHHTLDSFCRWQMNINSKDGHANHHDVAILLTRVNICARMNEPCSTLGLSQVSGLCQPHRSCNINEDTGLALAFTVAHELGHNFGMKHDTPENGCEEMEEEEEGMKYVMSAQLTAEASPLIWSNCSQAAITTFLDRDWGFCLNNEPTNHSFTFPILPPGVMYDADHQCRLQYGPEAEYCDGIQDLCITLWCRVDKKCLTKMEAGAEGTICKANQWCFGGRCVEIGDKPSAIDSNWGEWGAWSQCTRTCGAGVTYSERHCDNPPPSNGGRYCLGERRRHRICNTNSCPADSLSFREHQCAEFDKIPHKGDRFNWEPVTTQATPCQLHCKPKGRFFSVMLKDMVSDGTPCTIGRKDMCISGRCRKVGCDWVIDSDAIEDKCGVCHGDGTTCKTVRENFHKESGLGYVEAAVFPVGARNIRVEEVAEANNYLAIRADSGQYYLNGNWYIQWTGDYPAAGSVIRYRRDGNKESFIVPGPIKEPLHIMLLFQSQNPGIKMEYTVPDENMAERKKPEFHWKFTDWSHCTESCGGGHQISSVICFGREEGIVDNTNCNPLTRPDDRSIPCNEHLCPAKWWSGPWQHCSVSCGDGGKRRRTVLCVRQLGPDEQIALKDWECEGFEKPTDSTPCRSKDPCPVEDAMWQTGPWIGICKTDDPCTATQKRLVTCIEPSGLCNQDTKPPGERRCPRTDCGTWVASDWTRCTSSCGGGSQLRSVTCVGGKECSSTEKPRSDKVCNTHECPVKTGYHSNHGYHDNSALKETDKTVPTKEPNYQVMSPVADDDLTTEDDGFRQEVTIGSEAIRTTEETYTTVATAGDESNSTQTTRPVDSRFRWMSQYWTECSTPCGDGVQARKVHCIQVASREIVSEELCGHQPRPIAVQDCHNPPCNPWSTTTWSQCSATCGEGVQNRNVTCDYGDMCSRAEKPEEMKICDAGPCVEWVTEPWSECSQRCGGGSQNRTVRCVDLVTQRPADTCDILVQPPAQRDCNQHQCPSEADALERRQSPGGCVSDSLAVATCQAMRRMGRCSQVYIQRKCCQSCHGWVRSSQGLAPAT